jgi:hypothetical protein
VKGQEWAWSGGEGENQEGAAKVWRVPDVYGGQGEAWFFCNFDAESRALE